MFITKISINNFRLFNTETFELGDFHIPDEITEGSGINVFVGENGCGKTTLLEALTLPILEYKSDAFTIEDMNDPLKEVHIKIFAKESFDVQGTMPNSKFKAKGFDFKANLRNKTSRAYFSSVVVSDQLFIKENPEKPTDGSPDLRLSVNNPFSGKRFAENDILYLDKSRLYQTRTGNFNSTRFDHMMEDFEFQYIKKTDPIIDLSDMLSQSVKKDKVSNTFLGDAIQQFKSITDIQINLGLIDNYHPHKNASFVLKKSNNQQLKLSNLGSGYEMIFSLIYSFNLSRQSGKQLIVLIDEPELHMHPTLQEQLISLILSMSKHAQIFLSTHSSLFIKQLASNNAVKIMIIKKNCQIAPMEERKLSYVSANEINFVAFDLATEEYHNELYEELKNRYGEDKQYKDFDNTFFIQEKKEKQQYPWKHNDNQVSIHTFIRNQIHHPNENGKTDTGDLRASIENMRSFFDPHLI